MALRSTVALSSRRMVQHKNVAVIGAGVIGTCIAAKLVEDGHGVTLIDPLEPGRATSYGNAGGIAATAMAPLSMPGTIWKVPGWLTDPLGPLTIRWSYLPQLAPWLWRFWRAGTPEKVEKQADALAALLKRTYADWDPLWKAAGLDRLVKRDGCLRLYESRADYEADEPEWKLKRDRGVRIEMIDRHEIRQLEPDLAPIYEMAVFTPEWNFVTDPYRIVTGVADYATGRGLKLWRGKAVGVRTGADGIEAVITDTGVVACDAAVVAAGAWSHDISEWLGSPVPLETERGYHMTLPRPNVEVRHTLNLGGWVMTPMEMGLRLAGTVELAGRTAAPNWKRAEILVTRAKRALPKLDATDGSPWMGHRPSLPDSLPVISASPRHRNVFFAFGAAHLGLTEGATTGALVADLVAGRTPSIDMTPYRIDRF
ncbi:MAG: FAD-binding oxidoreductase [Alphaproteobacteria bacterium]|nr:FAD-binding oxidoreductase [Alphaproteobacteria bacterium]